MSDLVLAGLKAGILEFKKCYDESKNNKGRFQALREVLTSLESNLAKVQELVDMECLEGSQALSTLKTLVGQSVQCIRDYEQQSCLFKLINATSLKNKVDQLAQRIQTQLSALNNDVTSGLALAKEKAQRAANEVRAKLRESGPEADLSGCGINALVAKEIALDLGKKNTTKLLGLSVNPIGPVGAKELASHIARIDSLEQLIVDGCGLGDDGVDALSDEHLTSHKRLQCLNLDGNMIGNGGTVAVARFHNIQRLSLHRNEIGDAGALEIAKLANLLTLGLSHNAIGDFGARAIAKLSKLQALDLRYNKIGDTGARAIASLSGLRSLGLEHNELSDEGKDAVKKALSGVRLGL